MKKINIYLMRIFFSVLFITLFFLPVSAFSLNLLEAKAARPETFSIFDVIIHSAKTRPLIQSFSLNLFFYIQLYLPLSALFLLASLFFKRNMKSFCRFLIIIGLSLYIFIAAVCMITFANCLRWFLFLPLYIYASVFLCILCHINLTFYTISHHKNGKVEYETIRKIRQQESIPPAPMEGCFRIRGKQKACERSGMSRAGIYIR